MMQEPPFWGNRCIDLVPPAALVPYIDKRTLYRLHWRYRQPDYVVLDKKLSELLLLASQQQLFMPRAMYGYYAALRLGNAVQIFSTSDPLAERARITFPADSFLLSTVSDTPEQKSRIAFQLVTIDGAIHTYLQTLFKENCYTDYLHWHGLTIALAEAAATYVHARIRADLGYVVTPEECLRAPRGSLPFERYSFGYPNCPAIDEHAALCALLESTKIGVQLTDTFQFVPETSTAAMVFI